MYPMSRSAKENSQVAVRLFYDERGLDRYYGLLELGEKQRKMVKNKSGEMQFGGVIYGDAAQKASRFIANCNQRNIPLIFLQDVTGFMVGSKAEHGGIIKDGAKMINAVSNSIVPKFTIVLGNSFLELILSKIFILVFLPIKFS